MRSVFRHDHSLAVAGSGRRSESRLTGGQKTGANRLFGRLCFPRRPYDPKYAVSEVAEPLTVDVASAGGEEEDPEVKRMRTEAVLLLSKSPVSARKLAQLALLADATEARTMVRDLNQLYDGLGRAIRVESIAGGYRMLTRPAVAPWLARLGHLPPPVRLSSPMLETLTVVAYRQPVSRANVEAVRGVGCGELLRQLMERDLVRIAGRSEELGRPYLYGTTKRFLQIFGLSSPDALPPIDWDGLQDDVADSETDVSESLPDDPTSEESLTLPTESVVSTLVAPALPEADIESTVPVVISSAGQVDAPQAVIEDEEDDLYEGRNEDDYDDEDDDWDNVDDVDEDSDDDLDGDDDEESDDEESDDDLDEDDLDEDDDDVDEASDKDDDDWKEVDDEASDEDWDEEEDDDSDDDWEEDDSEAAEDDEEWS